MIKILFVEYSQAWQDLFKTIFEPPEYDLEITSDIDKAMELMRRYNYDIAIIEPLNPKMFFDVRSSINILLYIKDNHPDLPRIVFTGDLAIPISAFFKNLDVDEVILKGRSNIDILIKAINIAIDKRKRLKPIFKVLNEKFSSVSSLVELVEKINSENWLPTNLENLGKDFAEIFPKLQATSSTLATAMNNNLYVRNISLRNALNDLEILDKRIHYIGNKEREIWQPVIEQWQKIILNEPCLSG